MKKHLEEMMKKKSFQSQCKSRVVGIALSKRKNIIDIVLNKPTRNLYENPFSHAEYHLIARWGKKIRTILIARFNKKGERLPIKACQRCQDFADRLGIIIKEI